MEVGFLQLHTPVSMQRLFAERVRNERVELGLTQQTLAKRAGVALPTLRRFEHTGEGSLKLFMRICHALGRLDEMDSVLRPRPAETLDALERRMARRGRQRGTL